MKEGKYLSHISAEACQNLWASVLHRMLIDATRPICRTGEQRRDKHEAHTWLCSSDSLFDVCALAGIDGTALREKYRGGMITHEMASKANRPEPPHDEQQ